MAKTKIVQNSLVSGVMSEKAFGRTDISRFFNSVAEGTNVSVQTTGGLFKRPGFEFIDSTDVLVEKIEEYPQGTRMIDFVFNTEQKYLFILRFGAIDIYHVPNRDELLNPVGRPFATIAVNLNSRQIKEVSFIQRGDTTIIFHTDFNPKVILRADYESFVLGDLNIIPPKDSGGFDYWTDILGWPSYGTFFQGRMYCASSLSFPLTVWGSKSQDYFDFYIDPAQASADGSPILDTIDSDKINAITGIYSGRNLQVFTTGAEFVNLAEVITPTNSIWRIQTRYGSNHNVPLESLDGSTFFCDRNSAVREFVYDYNQDANISNDLTTLSSQLFSNPYRLDVVKSAKSTLGRYTYILNDDGTVAVLNFNKAESIIAWVKFEHAMGPIVEICAVDNELYILVHTDYGISLERLDLSDNITYLDNHTYEVGTKYAAPCGELSLTCDETVGGISGTAWLLDGIWCPSCPIFNDAEHAVSTTITGLERFNGLEVSYLLDGVYQGEILITDGTLTIDREFTLVEVGIKFNSVMKTMPASSPDFDMELAFKRIIKIKFYLYESSGFYLNGDFIPSTYFDIDTFDTKLPTKTGTYEYWALGWDEIMQFEITSDDPLGFNVLKFETTLDVTE